MSFVYVLNLSVDLGAVFAPVGELMDQLGAELARFGYPEKPMVRSPMINCTVTTEHELTEKEREIMKNALLHQFDVDHPAWKVKVESFRRKSGNVLQSAKH